jgi:hypothetical protein
LRGRELKIQDERGRVAADREYNPFNPSTLWRAQGRLLLRMSGIKDEIAVVAGFG